MDEQHDDARTVQVTVAQFDRWQTKITKLNRRAEAKGFPGRVELTGQRDVVVNDGRFDPLPRGVQVVVVNAVIRGEAPCYGDWRLVAALDVLPTGDGEEPAWVVRYAPGVDEVLVDRSQLRAGWCGHCQKRRPNRRRLVAVQHTVTGEIRQVGSTCLRDHLGWSTAPVFVTVKDVEDELDRFGGWQDAFTPLTVVTAALAAAEATGWTSRTIARDYGRPATVDLVTDYLIGAGRSGAAARQLVEPHIAAATAAAAEVIAAVQAEFADAEHGYGANLHAVLRAEAVESRQFALVCSTVGAYQRIVADRAKQSQDAEAAPAQEWLGQVGDKVEITGTIRTRMVVDGYAWNSSQVLLIVDSGPILAKFYTGAAWAYEDEVRVGATIRISATVKAHDRYRDEKQTVLVRAKGVVVVDETAADAV